jgi:hypothetical protein
MKLFLVSTLLVASGAGWLGLSSSDTKATECRATVECTPQGTCVVTCYDDAGAVICQKEIACSPEDCEPAACNPSACGR